MPLDENDARYYAGKAEDLMGKHRKAIGCGCFTLLAIVIALIILSIVAPLLMGGNQVESDDLGQPGVERSL